MGQTIGWIIGWDLTLEYAVAGASVAQGWSTYFNALLRLMGGSVPRHVSQPRSPITSTARTSQTAPCPAACKWRSKEAVRCEAKEEEARKSKSAENAAWWKEKTPADTLHTNTAADRKSRSEC